MDTKVTLAARCNKYETITRSGYSGVSFLFLDEFFPPIGCCPFGLSDLQKVLSGGLMAATNNVSPASRSAVFVSQEAETVVSLTEMVPAMSAGSF